MPYCQCCELDQPRVYCSSCIHQGVNAHLQWARGLRSQASAAVAKASSVLDCSPRGVVQWRRLRAEVAEKEKECERLRRLVEERRANLAQVSKSKSGASSYKIDRLDDSLIDLRRARILEYKRKQAQVADRILHARRVLVTEATSIFAVGQAHEGEWEIAGLPLPGPEHFRSRPPLFVNAALVHLIHLLSLITRYLSITLPFYVAFPSRPHVGRPSIKANTPYINTSKFRDKMVLWMSSTATRRDPRSRAKHRQFLTAFGLLSHSVSYLAWSQGVEGVGIEGPSDESGANPPVHISATALLQLIDALVNSPKMGLRSHEPGTSLLEHLGFSLDVHKVVAAVLDVEGEDENEGWDMVDDASTV